MPATVTPETTDILEVIRPRTSAHASSRPWILVGDLGYNNFVSIWESRFGAAGDGVADDSAAVLAASVAAIDAGVPLLISGGTFLLGSTLALTSDHNNLKWILGGATIKKGFNGDLVTLTGTSGFALDGVGVVDGQHGTYTGKGFVFSGAASTDPYFGAGILFKDFTDSHIEFGVDAGKYAKVDSNFRAHSSQSSPRMIHVNGPDTGAMQRDFNGSMNGYIDLDGSNATHIRSQLLNRVEISSDSSITLINGVSWSNNGNAMSIDGSITIITGCRFAGNVTLESTMSGVFVGNDQTSGTFTDNTTTGNCTVIHEAKTYLQSGTVALPSLTFTGDTDTGFWKRTGNVITVSNAGVDNFEFQGLALLLGATTGIRWVDSSTISAAASFPTGLRGGNGAPSAGFGNNGEYYLRGDGTVSGNTVLYHKEAGAWVALTTA